MNTEFITKKIEASLESIRPYLKADGGDVIVKEITTEHVVKLEFVGACSQCTSHSRRPRRARALRKGRASPVPDLHGLNIDR